MPHPKGHVKLSGDTHLPDLDEVRGNWQREGPAIAEPDAGAGVLHQAQEPASQVTHLSLVPAGRDDEGLLPAATVGNSLAVISAPRVNKPFWGQARHPLALLGAAAIAGLVLRRILR